MAHVSLNCPQLLDLDFQSCHKLSDNAIRQAATACPLLAKLDMSSCSCVTDETLREISSSCPNLAVLDASNCPNISFEVCLILCSVSRSCLLITHTTISRKIIPAILFFGGLVTKSVRLPMLIDLRLLSCEGMTSASMAAIAYSRLLEVVIQFLWYNFA